MAINILSALQGLVGSEMAKQAPAMLGESAAGTTSAISSVLPALLGSMMQQGGTAAGAGNLLTAINQPVVNSNIMSSLGGLFGGGDATNALTSAGGPIVNSLLGNKLGGVTSAISAVSGIGAGSAGTLLTMAAPLLFGFLKNHAATNNLDAHGLMSLLGGQKDAVHGAMDSRVASALGMTPVASTTAKVASVATATAHTATAAVEETAGGLGKILPWLLGGAAILAAAYFFMGHKETPAPAVEPAPAVMPATPAAEPAGKVLDLAGGEKITVKAGGFMENFYDAINNKNWDMTKALRLDQVNFDTGKATVTADSAEEVKDIAAVMKAYPTVAIKLVGATDNVGDATANKVLSAGRSAAVKAGVVALGTSADRIATDGIGEDSPVASNDTSEGKTQNRRVDVYITKK